jgi:hypothetical protein
MSTQKQKASKQTEQSKPFERNRVIIIVISYICVYTFTLRYFLSAKKEVEQHCIVEPLGL